MAKLAQLAPDLPEIETADIPLWVLDDELADKIHVPRDTFRRAMMMYDSDPTSRFPKKEKLYGDRRFWPAIWDFWTEVYRPRVRLLRSSPNDR